MDNQQFVQSAKIALLIDFDNVILGVDEPGFDVELVVNALRSRGVVVMGRAYGDWYRHHRHRRKLMEQGIELVETPVFGPLIKNSADIRIVLDGIDIATAHTHIDTFCLVSGDSDFLPLIKRLQLLGKNVIVIAGNKFTSDLVRRNCNEYVSYENLLAESVGATEDATTLEGAFHLLGRAINTLEERGMDVRSSAVKQMMLQLNPVFSERTFGCYQFKQFLDRASRAGIVTLQERDTNGEHGVEMRDRTTLSAPSTADEKTETSSTRVPVSSQNGVRESSARESIARDSFARDGITSEKAVFDKATSEKSVRERMRNSNKSGRRFGRRDKDNTEAASQTSDNLVASNAETSDEKSAEIAVQSDGQNQTSVADSKTSVTNGAISTSALTSRPGVRRGRLRFSAKSGRVEAKNLEAQDLEAQGDGTATPDSSTRNEGVNEDVSASVNASVNASANEALNEAAPVEQALDTIQTPEEVLEGASEVATSTTESADVTLTETPTETPKKRTTRGGRRSKTKKTDTSVESVTPDAVEVTVADEASSSTQTLSAPSDATPDVEPDVELAVSKAATPEDTTPEDATIAAAEDATPDAVSDAATNATNATNAPLEEKKKTSRGRRGGAKRTAAKRAKAEAQSTDAQSTDAQNGEAQNADTLATAAQLDVVP